MKPPGNGTNRVELERKLDGVADVVKANSDVGLGSMKSQRMDAQMRVHVKRVYRSDALKTSYSTSWSVFAHSRQDRRVRRNSFAEEIDYHLEVRGKTYESCATRPSHGSIWCAWRQRARLRYSRTMSSTSQPLLKFITVDPQATHTATVILVHVNSSR